MANAPNRLLAASAAFARDQATQHQIETAEHLIVAEANNAILVVQAGTAQEFMGVTTELHEAAHELAKSAVAHADAVKRRGDEVDTMLAQIRSVMATSTL